MREPGLLDIGAEVPVAEHYALGIACSAGSIDDGGDVHRLGVLGGTVAGVFGLIHTDEAEVADVDDDVKALQGRVTYLRQLLARHEDGFGVGMHEYVLHLVRRDLREHWDGDAAVGSDGEKRDAPVGHILGKDRDLVRSVDAESGQYAGEAVAGLLETGIGIMLPAVHIVRSGTLGVSGRGIIQYVRKSGERMSHQWVRYFSGCLPIRSIDS